MPTVHRYGPYRFHFFAADGKEPRHIHVDRDDLSAKFWLDAVSLARASDYGESELRKVERLVIRFQGKLRRKWDEFFGH